ncbi:hypothetical protein C1N73_28360 (plasmid) [Priestia aryabhattai]
MWDTLNVELNTFFSVFNSQIRIIIIALILSIVLWVGFKLLKLSMELRSLISLIYLTSINIWLLCSLLTLL